MHEKYFLLIQDSPGKNTHLSEAASWIFPFFSFRIGGHSSVGWTMAVRQWTEHRFRRNCLMPGGKPFDVGGERQAPWCIVILLRLKANHAIHHQGNVVWLWWSIPRSTCCYSTAGNSWLKQLFSMHCLPGLKRGCPCIPDRIKLFSVSIFTLSLFLPSVDNMDLMLFKHISCFWVGDTK